MSDGPAPWKSDLSLDDIVFLAHIADQADRHQEMCEYMHIVATTERPESGEIVLTPEERQLFSTASKRLVINSRRSWRILSLLEKTEESRSDDEKARKVRQFRMTVEDELRKICNNTITVIEHSLLRDCHSVEARLFYLKLAADYYRYLAEFTTGQEQKDVSSQAKSLYEQAMKEASASLSMPSSLSESVTPKTSSQAGVESESEPVKQQDSRGKQPRDLEDDGCVGADDAVETAITCTSPMVLGLSLNYSVFLNDIVGNREEAIRVNRVAYERALLEIDTLLPDDFKESVQLVHQLRENLIQWTGLSEPSEDPKEREDLLGAAAD